MDFVFTTDSLDKAIKVRLKNMKVTSNADYEDSTHCAVRSAFIHLISAHLIRSNRVEPSACTVSVDPHSHFLTHEREEFKTCH
jgi:hypothetical protein